MDLFLIQLSSMENSNRCYSLGKTTAQTTYFFLPILGIFQLILSNRDEIKQAQLRYPFVLFSNLVLLFSLTSTVIFKKYIISNGSDITQSIYSVLIASFLCNLISYTMDLEKNGEEVTGFLKTKSSKICNYCKQCSSNMNSCCNSLNNFTKKNCLNITCLMGILGTGGLLSSGIYKLLSNQDLSSILMTVFGSLGLLLFLGLLVGKICPKSSSSKYKNNSMQNNDGGL